MTSSMPEELAQALADDLTALATFDELPVFHRRQHIDWVTSCRTEATRKARAADVVRMLRSYAHGRRQEMKRRSRDRP